MVNKNSNRIQIDVVFTWVDSNDPVHINKMIPYLENTTNSLSNKHFKTGFDQVNEIEYSINSIISFAPFIRKIFIVTDNQTPSFLEKYNRTRLNSQPEIEVVDHKSIFGEYNSILPVFNCRPIESMLFNIEDLSEFFVYFNDDFFLIKPTEPSDFFREGTPVLRGKWTKFDEQIWYKQLHQFIVSVFGGKSKKNKYGYKRGQQKSAKILGLNKYLKINHGPAPMRKSTLKNYFEANPDILSQNVLHRFRNPIQYVLQSLANHIEIVNNTYFLERDLKVVFFRSYKWPLYFYKLKLKFVQSNRNKLFMCMQSLDLCPRTKKDYLLNWLKSNTKRKY